MPAIKPIFQGVTNSTARRFISSVVKQGHYSRVVLPCVGSFAALSAVVQSNQPKDTVFSSDISIYSSIIGYLADPTKGIDALPIKIEGEAALFTENAKDAADKAAGLLLFIKYTQTRDETLFDKNMRREILDRRAVYRAEIRRSTVALMDIIGGVHYDVADLRDVLNEAKTDEKALVYFNAPGYNKGFGKQFSEAEAMLDWQGGLSVREFNPKDTPQLMQDLTDQPATVMTYLHGGSGISAQTRIEDLPEGWHILYAFQKDANIVHYIVSNHPSQIREAIAKTSTHDPRLLPIYNDEEITPDSVVTFLPVERDTALYYRDLFVHKLGVTDAERFFLMLIDGRVTTSVGLVERDVRLWRAKNAGYLGESFGITKSSKRYKRMDRLFMMCLTSGDMKRLVMSSWKSHYREPIGISTTCLAVHEELKSNRGILKLVLREKMPSGQFRLLYKADFRNDTWADVLKTWLKNHGGVQRG